MQIASWNVNSIRTRLDHVLRWLDQSGVDLLALQETKVDDPLFPLEAFDSRGYAVSFHGQKSYNGVALISRHPLEDVRMGFLGDCLLYTSPSPRDRVRSRMPSSA